MHRRLHVYALIAGAFFPACVQASFAQVANAPLSDAPRWQVFAGCAAAYLANWQDRLSDPTRAPSMSAMIQDESEHYKLTAIAYYEKDQKASKDEANRSVDVHVKANVERFIAMDKAGTLEGYIDRCPQIEEPN
jgi:hypothetical protein